MLLKTLLKNVGKFRVLARVEEEKSFKSVEKE
jgi:hypothetical protein